MMRRGVLTLVLMVISLLVSLLPERARRIICHEQTASKPALVEVLVEREVFSPISMPSTATLLVVDTSGSTRNQDLSMRTRALDYANNYGNVGLVSYGDHSSLLVKPGGKVAEVMDTLPSRGGSNLVAGLQEALAWFARAGVGGRIVLVSDGSMNSGDVDPGALIGLAAEARSRNVVIDVFPMGQPEGTLLQDLSSATYGSYNAETTYGYGCRLPRYE
jgi:Mg-chelatase subunit ChlD